MELEDTLWLAGYLEGEGSFSFATSPTIAVSATDRDVVEKVAHIMGGRFEGIAHSGSTLGTKPIYRARVHGDKAIAIMKQVLPHMGERRAKRISEVLQLSAARPGRAKLTPADVIQIRREASSGGWGIQGRLAKRYGVSKVAICQAVNRIRWRYLDQPAEVAN